VTVIDKKRPYIIIDPRAGHGPGIGGFKADSQVGVALRDDTRFILSRSAANRNRASSSLMSRGRGGLVREVMRRISERQAYRRAIVRAGQLVARRCKPRSHWPDRDQWRRLPWSAGSAKTDPL
jgi:hypothetical protein